MKTSHATESVPERGRYDRFRNEVMAGGSVTEKPVSGDDEPAAGPIGAVIGFVFLGLLLWLAVVNMWMFVFVLGILISVFLHETGHFVTARMTGMKATQFFLGFGPRIWSFHRGETEYGLRALPLGAFLAVGALVLLFLIGHKWGQMVGGRPWRIGGSLVLLGIVLVVITTMLGG